MPKRARLTVLVLLSPLLTQCGPGPAPAAGAVTGPFDRRGNYVEEWADSPDKWYRPTAPSDRPKQQPALLAKKDPEPAPRIAVVEPRPVSPAPSVAPKPKPKPVVVKPKPKPKLVKYSVKRGDTLSRIASKHGVSLSALRRANGISGDLIRPGQALTIPR